MTVRLMLSYLYVSSQRLCIFGLYGAIQMMLLLLLYSVFFLSRLDVLTNCRVTHGIDVQRMTVTHLDLLSVLLAVSCRRMYV